MTPPNDTTEAIEHARRLEALPLDLRDAIDRQRRFGSSLPILDVAEECARLRDEVARLREERRWLLREVGEGRAMHRAASDGLGQYIDDALARIEQASLEHRR